MDHHNKVVWTEGMFLRPHHFQQQDRYVEQFANLQLQATQVAFDGFSELEISTEELDNGIIMLSHAKGIMPDGTPFALAPGQVQPLDIPVGKVNQWVCLALPKYRLGAEDVVFDDSADSLARFLVTETELSDNTEIALGETTVQVGQLRFTLMLESDVPVESTALRLFHVLEKNSQKKLILESDGIPQIINYRASSTLVRWAHRIRDLLETRAMTLSKRLHKVGRSSVADISELMMLETINRYRGAFHHCLSLSQAHPERLFRDFLMLASDMATFTESGKMWSTSAFPEYYHNELKRSFEPLLVQLEKSLNIVLRELAVSIELLDKGHGLQVAQLPDKQLMHSAELVFAVQSELPADVLGSRFPSQAKVGSVEKIRDLVHLQLPGINLRLLNGTPPQLPYNSSQVYFALEKSGDMWKQFEKTGALALHLAGDFPGLTLQFWAIRPE